MPREPDPFYECRPGGTCPVCNAPDDPEPEDETMWREEAKRLLAAAEAGPEASERSDHV
jgi:hypothetical protein